MITLWTLKEIVTNNFTFFLSNIRMSRKNVNFEAKKIKQSDIYKNKNVTRVDDIDVNKKLVSNEESYGTTNSFK